MIQHDEDAVVSHARARTLADCWRDEQDAGAPVSALADTGAISDETVWVLRSDLQRLERAVADSEVEEPMSSRGQLRALLRYVTACGERGPVPGWAGLTDRDIYSDHSVPVRRPAAAPAPAQARSRADDRVVPFPVHRARSGDEVVRLASRRLRTAEDAPPVRRPREDAAELTETTPLAARRVRSRDDAPAAIPSLPRPRDDAPASLPRLREGDDTVVPRPRHRPDVEDSGFGPAEVSRPEEWARPAPDRAYPSDDEVVYSALDGPYGDVDWTG